MWLTRPDSVALAPPNVKPTLTPPIASAYRRPLKTSVPLPPDAPMIQPPLTTVSRIVPISEVTHRPTDVQFLTEVIARSLSGGSGTLVFKGRRYALAIGGVSVGFTFGGARATLSGRVSHIRRPSDVEGVYGAAGAGGALGPG